MQDFNIGETVIADKKYRGGFEVIIKSISSDKKFVTVYKRSYPNNSLTISLCRLSKIGINNE
jgi:hypothetical protein